MTKNKFQFLDLPGIDNIINEHTEEGRLIKEEQDHLHREVCDCPGSTGINEYTIEIMTVIQVKVEATSQKEWFDKIKDKDMTNIATELPYQFLHGSYHIVACKPLE